MSRIIESVEKHYDNGIELEFNTLYQVLCTLQNEYENKMRQALMFLGNGSLIAIVQPQILKQLVMPMSLYGLAIDGDRSYIVKNLLY